MAGIDCPELNNPNGIQAKDFTEKALRSAKTIEIENLKRGKYFRIIADVIYDGNNLSNDLIAAGLAVPYIKKIKSNEDVNSVSVAKLESEIALLKKENLALRKLCRKTGIQIPGESIKISQSINYEWKIIGHFGIITTVYVDKDAYYIAQILHSVENSHGKGNIWFFDNPKYTPRGVPMTDEQMLHQIGTYDSDGIFQYIKITNSYTSPPEIELINTNIRPGYVGQ